MTHRIKGAKNQAEENAIFNKDKKKTRGIHADTRSGLRKLKKGEKVTYSGGGFHIVKM